MTTPGDTSMASLAEVQHVMRGGAGASSADGQDPRRAPPSLGSWRALRWLERQPSLRHPWAPRTSMPVGTSLRARSSCRPTAGTKRRSTRFAGYRKLPGRRLPGIVAYAPCTERRCRTEDRCARRAAARRGRAPAAPGGARGGDHSPTVDGGSRLLAERGSTFDLCVSHEQLRAVAQLVEACPETSFVLDHLGKPAVAARLLDPWRRDIARLAGFPNVTCKLSGLATEAGAGWTSLGVRRTSSTRSRCSDERAAWLAAIGRC